MWYMNALYILMGSISSFLSSPEEKGQTKISGYIVNNGELKTINIREEGFPPEELQKYEIPISKGQFSQHINLADGSFFKIMDGSSGHSIFLQPGDSVSIALESIQNLQARQKEGEFFSKFHQLRVQSAEYPGNLLLMDQLDSLRQELISKKAGLKDPALYKSSCDAFYYLADSMLNAYKDQQYISGEFYPFGKSVINVQYLLWICSIMANTPTGALPGDYLDLAKELDFNNPEHARKVPGYMTAAYIQNMYAFSDFSPQNPYANMRQSYSSIKHTRNGFIRDRLAAWTIMEYTGKNHPSFDSLYRDFITTCTNKHLKDEVNENLQKDMPASIGNQGSLSIPALNAPVTDINGRIFALYEILDPDKITIIDNWATWCTPCLSELPYIHALDSAYQDKIQFVYLSYDSDKSSWEKFVAEQEKYKTSHYLLQKNFKSAFAEALNVSSIPRYIAIDGSKRWILESAMPRPSGQLFEAQVKSYLK